MRLVLLENFELFLAIADAFFCMLHIQGFWSYLRTIDASNVKVYAQREGSVVFPRIPLLRVEGPLAACQVFALASECFLMYLRYVCWLPRDLRLPY